jgi:hypothetical protein
MLGAQPLVGRMFVPADEAKGAPAVVVLTHAYWQRVFGSDPSAVGQTLDLTVKQAERGMILRMILGEGAAMALVGLVLGGVAAIPLSTLLKGLLFGVEPADPPTLALSAALLVGVALVATWIPARRATAVDPITALRRD